jgi:hypothetical protein
MPIAGPMWERTAQGHRIPNKRTNARIEGTEKLEIDRPWVSTTDLELWLLGFDAGEQFALGSHDKQEREVSPRS